MLWSYSNWFLKKKFIVRRPYGLDVQWSRPELYFLSKVSEIFNGMLIYINFVSPPSNSSFSLFQSKMYDNPRTLNFFFSAIFEMALKFWAFPQAFFFSPLANVLIVQVVDCRRWTLYIFQNKDADNSKRNPKISNVAFFLILECTIPSTTLRFKNIYHIEKGLLQSHAKVLIHERLLHVNMRHTGNNVNVDNNKSHQSIAQNFSY